MHFYYYLFIDTGALARSSTFITIMSFGNKQVDKEDKMQELETEEGDVFPGFRRQD